MENSNVFENIMKDIGVNDFDELLEWIENNRETQLAQSIIEFISFVNDKKEK